MWSIRALRSGLIAVATSVAFAPAAGAQSAANVFSIAGNGHAGFSDGVGSQAEFNNPAGLGIDGQGTVYITDEFNERMRKMFPDGNVQTIAGNDAGNDTDGLGTSASFNHPSGVAVGPDGNLYIADRDNGLVRKISPDGSVSNYTPGQFYSQPQDIAVAADDTVYVSETLGNDIKRITPGGQVSTFASNIDKPWGLAVDSAGNLYVAESGQQRILKFSSDGSQRAILSGSGQYGVGDGSAKTAQFGRLAGMAIDNQGYLYVVDTGTHRIRRVSPDGSTETLAGINEGFADGSVQSAEFDEPIGIATDRRGTVYISDSKNQRIRKLTGFPPDGTKGLIIKTSSQNNSGSSGGRHGSSGKHGASKGHGKRKGKRKRRGKRGAGGPRQPLFGPIVLSGPTHVAGGCITSLPATFTIASQYAASYGRSMRIAVSTAGPPIRNLRVSLYTFGGVLLGSGRLPGVLSGSAHVTLRLRFGAQVGSFSFVASGEPNASPSCGPKPFHQVILLRPCLTRLPVKFPSPPGGSALGFSSKLSVPIETQGPLISNIDATLSTFSGQAVGHAKLAALFGQTTLNFALTGPLAPGGYSVFVRGALPQPASCGTKTATGILHFG